MKDEQFLQHIDEKVDTLDERLDRHLEIYAANGKESARVANALETLINRSAERDAKVDEMLNLFNTFKGGKTVIKWIFGIIMAIGSLWLLIIKINGK